jgi:hypothetical protein
MPAYPMYPHARVRSMQRVNRPPSKTNGHLPTACSAASAAISTVIAAPPASACARPDGAVDYWTALAMAGVGQLKWTHSKCAGGGPLGADARPGPQRRAWRRRARPAACTVTPASLPPGSALKGRMEAPVMGRPPAPSPKWLRPVARGCPGPAGAAARGPSQAARVTVTVT